ncbi:WhiB family transcriptional regulator [Streptomyces sp. NPDC006333]|uniref:WhiB family transcriptional regulator n=1 Tax=Streptomyces sp. NPDC006333 TaxID=3156753 RepID=UPI0033B0EBA2
MDAREPLRCRSDPDAYVADGVRPPAARALCAGCGVFEACRAYGLANAELWGVWGGTTRRERQGLRRGDRGPPGSRCVADAIPIECGGGAPWC